MSARGSPASLAGACSSLMPNWFCGVAAANAVPAPASRVVTSVVAMSAPAVRVGRNFMMLQSGDGMGDGAGVGAGGDARGQGHGHRGIPADAGGAGFKGGRERGPGRPQCATQAGQERAGPAGGGGQARAVADIGRGDVLVAGACRERESDTVTVPSEPETDEAPAVVVPKLTESGAVRERVPVTTVNVTLVGPVLAPAAPAAEAVRAASVSTNASRTDSGRRNGSPEGRAVDTEKGKDRWARRHRGV